MAAPESVLTPSRMADLLHDVCGNPYRRPEARRQWSPDVRELARTIELDRAFGRMPIHGDAGREDEEVVRPCQGSGPHALGCWVLDLALGRG